MATIKLYTNIKQSKKLAEILPIESADTSFEATGSWTPSERPKNVPCWSLAALLEQIPYKLCDDGNLMYLQINKEDSGYQLAYTDPYGDFGNTETNIYKDFVDACYEMILKLEENNLL